MNPTSVQLLGTICFVLGVIHTFCVNPIVHYSHHYKEGSMMNRLLHFFGEVEAVFGIWSLIFIIGYTMIEGFMVYGESHQLVGGAVHYLENVNFTEPAFVFVIMCMAGTRPILKLSEKIIKLFAKILPFPEKMAFYVSALVIGPLLGSFITEPAAMTVTSLLLLQYFYKEGMSKKFMYATIGMLFVNVSVGGTLTHFAAPPVLMVAGKWHWGIAHMLDHFGLKAAIGIIVTTVIYALIFKSELQGKLASTEGGDGKPEPKLWVTIVHILFMALVVLTAHHMIFFLSLFLFFIGFCNVTSMYQDTLKIKESLLVGFFLAGLVTLGGMQSWWLQEVLTKLPDLALYFGATALTAVTDNAALTYLGSLVEGLSDSAKYNLVAGAVTGGGLTVIANAPNPAGFGILKGSFGKEGISPLWLLVGALFPTFVMILAFQLIPSFNF